MSAELLTRPFRVRKPPEERVTFEEFSRMMTEAQKARRGEALLRRGH